MKLKVETGAGATTVELGADASDLTKENPETGGAVSTGAAERNPKPDAAGTEVLGIDAEGWTGLLN